MHSFYKFLLYTIGILFLVGLFAWFFSQITLFFIFSLILSTLLRPAVSFFLRMRIARVIAIMLAFTIAHATLFSIIAVFSPLLSSQADLFSQFNYEDLETALKPQIAPIEVYLKSKNLLPADQELLPKLLNYVESLFSTVDLNTLLSGIINIAGGFFISYISVLFITFVLLYQDRFIAQHLLAIVPNKYFEMVTSAIYKVESRFVRYLTGLSIQIMAIFSIASIGLSIAQVNYAITIALFAAIANLVPYLGPLLGASFGIIIGLSTFGGPVFSAAAFGLLLRIISVFVFVQILDNVILQPLIFSRSIKAHPLEVFIVIFAGATIAGIAGMVAAIPTYTMLKVCITEAYQGIHAYTAFRTR